MADWRRMLTVGAALAVFMLAVAGCGQVPGVTIVPGEPSGDIVGPSIPGFEPVTEGERLGIPKEVAMGRVGEAENAVYVMRRADAPESNALLIWMHGYGTNHVGSQERWLFHMTRGATVVFPAYVRPPFPVGQRFGQLAWPITARALRTALPKLDYDPRRVVVGGFSLGGALANDYAIGWEAEGLPKPYGLYSVYAGRARPDGEIFVPRQQGEISPRTDVVQVASPHDLLAGTREASFTIAKSPPEAPRKLILIREFEFGDHFAPTRLGLREQDRFWRPLDELVERVNRRADRVERQLDAARDSASS